MNPFIRIFLSLESVPDKDIADLDKSLPALARLCTAAKEIGPIIRSAMPQLLQLKAPAEKVLNIVEARWPDIVEVAPTIEEFIAIVNAKGNST
jgi:hypothetical protein